MLKLRLSRGGTKKRPVYKVVVADSRFAKGNLKGMSDKGIPPELFNQLK